jgi:hypothetical protein
VLHRGTDVLTVPDFPDVTVAVDAIFSLTP